MYLKKIYLHNFRNYDEFSAEFSSQVNCIVGNNGSGKTNLLDAVYFLALTKSSVQSQDALSINHNEDYMMLEGLFCKENTTEQITCSMQRGQRKALLHDKKPYERINDHIGKYPVVLISPDDTDLIRDASDTRRRLFDGIIAQVNNQYLGLYQHYNRLLDQRNSLLKQFAEQKYMDNDLLDIYSDPLVELATKIYEERRKFVAEYVPLFKKHYKELSEDRENVEIIYESEVASEDFARDFRNNRFADVQAQRTTKGIHKDDFVFELNQYPVKKFGSQGQKKSFVMALRLAQFEVIEKVKSFKPILLLDDIFDKLDDRRIHKLIESIDNKHFGQVFITDARPERTRKILENVQAEINYFTPSSAKQKT